MDWKTPCLQSASPSWRRQAVNAITLIAVFLLTLSCSGQQVTELPSESTPRITDTPLATATPVPTTTPTPEPTPTPSGGGSGMLAVSACELGSEGWSESTTCEIYILDLDRAEVVRLTDNDYYDGQPDWSPDGSKIVFVSDRGNGEKLYIMDADGSNVVELDSESELHSPRWAPAGERIVATSTFYLSGESFSQFVLVDADGSNLSAYGVVSGLLWGEWAPDGKQILFTHKISKQDVLKNQQDQSTLILADVGDSIPESGFPTNSLYYGEDIALGTPSWSQDGRRVVLHGYVSSQWQLYTFDMDTTTLERLVVADESDTELWCPRLSPDGTLIALCGSPKASDIFKYRLFVVNADGKGLSEVSTALDTDLSVECGFAWKP